MSTWTSRALLAATVLAVAGCGGAAPRAVAVTADRITVSGPEGFCVDPASARDSDDTAFVLLGSCAAIGRSRRAAEPVVPAFLTVAISAPGDPGRIAANLDGMHAFFRSAEGRRLLSRNADADSVAILDTGSDGDVFVLHARDTGAGAIDGVQLEHWRAYMDMRDRIATLSVLGLEGHGMADAQGRSILRAFVRSMRSANSGAAGVRP